jgi:hypothetical protein
MTHSHTSGQYLYYNIRFDNISNPANIAADIPANKTVKTGEILHHQSDYQVAIDFFSLRPQVPIFYAQIVEGSSQTDINFLQYGLSLRNAAGTYYPTRLVYVPDSTAGVFVEPKPPAQNGGLQDFTTGYYSVFSFWSMIEMMNTALEASYVAFNAANPGIHTSAPYWTFNEELGRVQLIYEESYYSNPNRARLYVNAQLGNFFEAIRIIFNNYGDPVNFSDWQQVLDGGSAKPYALPGATLPVPPLPPDYRILTQEYPCLYFWCNIKSIIFSSTSVSSAPEYLPSAYNPNAATAGNYQAFNQPTRSILAYFDLIVGEGGQVDWRQNLYDAPAYRKWMDLTDDGALNSFNLSIELQLSNGTTLPLYIPINGTIDIKVVFKKK